MNLAAATESSARVEDDASFGTHGKRREVQCGVPGCERRKRRPESVVAIVDWVNVVVSGLHESHIQNASTVPRSPMCRRRSVLVVQLDAQACSRATSSRTTYGKHTREKTLIFLQAVGHKDAREVRERWKTMTKIGCATLIDGEEDDSTMGVRGGRDAL